MYEVELKVRADHEAVRESIGALDAEFRGTIEQDDTYYDAPHKDFGETDEALRVRRERIVETAGESGTESEDRTETAVLTYKGPLVDSESKTRREIETDVGDGNAIEEALAALGFEPAATVSKTRSIYAAAEEEWTLVCDRVEGLGEFLEVELEAEEDRIETARERVYDVLEDLGLDPENGTRTSYLEMLLDRTGSAAETER
ncbi:class IV adenylate cyclase [Halobacteriales archaeon QH_8_64_26]|nr:MAG: class IV adenylate cyclase [Halobacteriales archaeon QH_8_64_26]